jgi:type VI secretion system secreted protein Hcp
VEHAAAGGVSDERLLSEATLPYVDAPWLRALTTGAHPNRIGALAVADPTRDGSPRVKSLSWRKWAAVLAAAAAAALVSTLLAGSGPATAETAKAGDAGVAACPQQPTVPPAGASSDYFLKIDGIEGESTDDRHHNEIEIASYIWTINATSLKDCVKAPQVPVFSGISFVKQLDKASPKLATAVTTGQHLPVAALTARRTGGDQQEYLKITLTDVTVTGYSMSATDATFPQDSFGLSFGKIRLDYFRQKPDGTLEPPISFCWDITGNTTC